MMINVESSNIERIGWINDDDWVNELLDGWVSAHSFQATADHLKYMNFKVTEAIAKLEFCRNSVVRRQNSG